MARLVSPSGPVVSVADEKVDGLLGRGFKRIEEPKKAPTKRSTSRKTSNK